MQPPIKIPETNNTNTINDLLASTEKKVEKTGTFAMSWIVKILQVQGLGK